MRIHLKTLLALVLGAAILAACGTPQPPTTKYELDVTLAGSGAGTVVSNPAGIDTAAAAFDAEFDEGTDVTLTATPAAGSVFTGWGGDCSGVTATCVVEMDAARSVTATFTLESTETATVTVAVLEGGDAEGSISSSPAGIGGGVLSAEFPVGSTVTLTASANPGGFYAWTGGACDGLETPTCTITVAPGLPTFTAKFNDVVTVSVRVGNSGTTLNADDGEEFLADSFNPGNIDGVWDVGFTYRSDQELELGVDPDHAPQAVGLRFRDVDVPKEAKLLSAVIGFTAYNAVGSVGTAGTVNLTISGQNADVPALIKTDEDPTLPRSFDITTRPRTSSSVAWSITEPWIAESSYSSSDVSEILAEIMARPGWPVGGVVFFILEPTDLTSTEFRRVYPHNTSPDKAARLTVEYVLDPAALP